MDDSRAPCLTNSTGVILASLNMQGDFMHTKYYEASYYIDNKCRKFVEGLNLVVVGNDLFRI